MTNYDRIKQMSIEEMATMLDNFHLDCSYCLACNFCNESFKDVKCIDTVKKWLEQEVDENDRQ